MQKAACTSLPSSENRCRAPLSRRNVLLGLVAWSLPAPAIVRVSSLMPVRRIVLTKTDRPSAGYIERLFYNALAANLRQGRITVSLNSRILTLAEAERLARKARQNGWICDPPVQLPTS